MRKADLCFVLLSGTASRLTDVESTFSGPSDLLAPTGDTMTVEAVLLRKSRFNIPMR